MMSMTCHNLDFGRTVLDLVACGCSSNASFDRYSVKSYGKAVLSRSSRGYGARKSVCIRHDVSRCRVFSTKTTETLLSGWSPLLSKKGNFNISERFNCPTKVNPSWGYRASQSSICCFLGDAALNIELTPSDANISGEPLDLYGTTGNQKINIQEISHFASDFMQRWVLADLDPATAKLAIGYLGPFLSAFGFLFILRIVMSWYPKLPVGKFPYVIAYAPTEPILIPTRKLIPPLGGVDVTPVVWFGLISFLNEILVGPQGLLVLLSQQVS